MSTRPDLHLLKESSRLKNNQINLNQTYSNNTWGHTVVVALINDAAAPARHIAKFIAYKHRTTFVIQNRILKKDFEVVWCWFGPRVVLQPDNNNTNNNLSLLSG